MAVTLVVGFAGLAGHGRGPAGPHPTRQAQAPALVAGGWTSREQVAGQAVLSGDTVIVPEAGGYLTGRDAANGDVRWRSLVTGPEVGSSAPGAGGGVAVVGVPDDGTVRAVAASDGALLWTTHVAQTVNSRAPLVSGGVVYVQTTGPQQVMALRAEDGSVAWTTPVSDSTGAVPALADGVLYLATSSLYAIDAITGTLRWTTPITDGRFTTGSPAVENGSVYLGDRDGQVRAFDARTGVERWRHQLVDLVGVQPSITVDTAVRQGTVVSVSGLGRLTALASTDGSVLWNQQVDALGASPVIAGQTVLVGAAGSLRSFDLATGRPGATLPEPDGCAISEPSAFSPSAVYFSGCRLTALPLPTAGQ